jgi:hypothetical protein
MFFFKISQALSALEDGNTLIKTFAVDKSTDTLTLLMEIKKLTLVFSRKNPCTIFDKSFKRREETFFCL